LVEVGLGRAVAIWVIMVLGVGEAMNVIGVMARDVALGSSGFSMVVESSPEEETEHATRKAEIKPKEAKPLSIRPVCPNRVMRSSLGWWQASSYLLCSIAAHDTPRLNKRVPGWKGMHIIAVEHFVSVEGTRVLFLLQDEINWGGY
jgi:hypothetical protein